MVLLFQDHDQIYHLHHFNALPSYQRIAIVSKPFGTLTKSTLRTIYILAPATKYSLFSLSHRSKLLHHIELIKQWKMSDNLAIFKIIYRKPFDLKRLSVCRNPR